MTITLQALQSDGTWSVRNAFVTENKEVQAGSMRAADLEAKARAMMARWQTVQDGKQLRVHNSANEPAPRKRSEPTITNDTWPRHADGRRLKIGEMTHRQQVAVARGAVARLTPEFASRGVALEFKHPA